MQAFPKVLPLTFFSPPSKPSPLVISSIFTASALIGMQNTPTSMTSAIQTFPQGVSPPFPTACQVASLALQCAPSHTSPVSIKPAVSRLGTLFRVFRILINQQHQHFPSYLSLIPFEDPHNSQSVAWTC